MLETSHLEVSDESAASNTIYTVNSMMGPFFSKQLENLIWTFLSLLFLHLNQFWAQGVILQVTLSPPPRRPSFISYSSFILHRNSFHVLDWSSAGGIPDLIWGSGLEEQPSVYFTAPVLESRRSIGLLLGKPRGPLGLWGENSLKHLMWWWWLFVNSYNPSVSGESFIGAKRVRPS